MKKILFILVLLLPVFASAQIFQSMPQPGYGPVKRFWVDSTLIIPTNITTGNNLAGGREVGKIRYNIPDSSIQVWTGSQWVSATGGGGGGGIDTTAWHKTGDSGTVAGTNFIGTVDNVDLVTKTNGVERSRHYGNGNFLHSIGAGNSYVVQTDHAAGNGSIYIGDYDNGSNVGSALGILPHTNVFLEVSSATGFNANESATTSNVDLFAQTAGKTARVYINADVAGTAAGSVATTTQTQTGVSSRNFFAKGRMSYMGDTDPSITVGNLHNAFTINDSLSRGYLDNDAHNTKFGINTNAPGHTLDVVGDFKLADGTQGAGKVLTSDAAGGASWQAASGSTTITNGVTPMSGFTDKYVPYNNAGTVGEYGVSGTGNVAMTTSPLFTTPRLNSTSTTGYVWTATDGSGNGSFQAASGGVTAVTASSPLASSGGAAPDISLTGTVPISKGGTNLTTYTTGDLIYANATDSLAKLGIGANGNVLTSNGTNMSWAAPAPASIAIGSLVTSAKKSGVFFGGTGGTLQQDSANFSYDSVSALKLGSNFYINKSYSPGNGGILKDATYGMILGGISGSTSDIGFFSSGGLLRMSISGAGAFNMPGAITTTSSISARSDYNAITFPGNTGGFGYQNSNASFPAFSTNSIGILSGGSGTLPIYMIGSKINFEIGNGTNSMVAQFAPTTGNLLLQNGGTFTDATTALFQASSTTKGVLLPRMTATQRDAISSPATGLEIFNTTDSTKSQYRGTGSGWQPVTYHAQSGIGQTTLSSGTIDLSISSVKSTSLAFITLVTPSGTTLTTSYQAVCTAGHLVIQANVAAGTINTADGSTLNYMVVEK